MGSNKDIGRVVGILFLLMLITGAVGNSLRGLTTALIESQTFLSDVVENSLQMKVAITLDLIASAIGIGIAIKVFPLLKQYSKSIAFWYFGLCLIGLAIVIVSNITHLSLITLSELAIKTEAANDSYFKTLATLKVEEYYWAHFLILIVFSLGASLFYYALIKSNLIPRVLSVWFLIAVLLVFKSSWLQIFGYTVNPLFYAQNGLHLLVLSIWLIVKGFNSSANTLEST